MDKLKEGRKKNIILKVMKERWNNKRKGGRKNEKKWKKKKD